MIATNGGYFSRQAFRNSAAIDDLREASETVESILATDAAPEAATPDGATAAEAQYQFALHYASLERRIRLLTWAVVAVAIVLVLKEAD